MASRKSVDEKIDVVEETNEAEGQRSDLFSNASNIVTGGMVIQDREGNGIARVPLALGVLGILAAPTLIGVGAGMAATLLTSKTLLVALGSGYIARKL